MDSQTLVSKALKQFTPPQRLKISEWATKYFELPETSAEPGRWSPDRAPYQSGIMDALSEPGIKQVSIMCSAQVGKTIVLLAVICYFIHLDPCSMLMTFPAEKDAEIFSKEKLSSAIRNVKPVSDRIVEKSRDASSTILMKMYVGGFLRLTGANSPSSLASMAIRIYLGDEVDKYPASAGKEGDPIELARKRTSTFWNWLMLLCSTPSTVEGSRINKEYELSDKRRYFVSCPYCAHEQHLVWERVEYSGKGTDSADPSTGVYYICEACDTPIEEYHKNKMVKGGGWKPTAKAKNPNHAGFHLNLLISPFNSWTDIALDYEKARRDPQLLQVFTNATLGLPFEAVAGEKLDWERLRDRACASNYQTGTVPQGGLILTAGVDVQQDRLEYAIVAWGRGEECFVVDYQKIIGDPLLDSTWEQLVHLASREYPRELGGALRVSGTCIDTGYLTQEVYHQIRKYRYLHWFGIKGMSGDRPIVSRPSVQEINYRGEKIKRGISLYPVGVDRAKETLYARSQIETPGAKYLNFPNNLDSEFYEGFCSEVQVTKHRNGHPYIVWEKLSGVRNEPLDLMVYGLAAAYLVGVTRMNWDTLESQILNNVSDKEICDEHMSVKSQSKRTSPASSDYSSLTREDAGEPSHGSPRVVRSDSAPPPLRDRSLKRNVRRKRG